MSPLDAMRRVVRRDRKRREQRIQLAYWLGRNDPFPASPDELAQVRAETSRLAALLESEIRAVGTDLWDAWLLAFHQAGELERQAPARVDQRRRLNAALESLFFAREDTGRSSKENHRWRRYRVVCVYGEAKTSAVARWENISERRVRKIREEWAGRDAELSA